MSWPSIHSSFVLDSKKKPLFWKTIEPRHICDVFAENGDAWLNVILDTWEIDQLRADGKKVSVQYWHKIEPLDVYHTSGVCVIPAITLRPTKQEDDKEIILNWEPIQTAQVKPQKYDNLEVLIVEDYNYRGYDFIVVCYKQTKPNLARIFLEGLGADHDIWWCGYVVIPAKHPYYNIHYDKVRIKVHGGLTYANNIPLTESKNYNEWVIGFDYGHGGDDGGNRELVMSGCQEIIDQLALR